VRRDLYDTHSQGEIMTALHTANLGYVRELRAPTKVAAGETAGVTT
jgi:hypothetical protein